MAITTLLGAGFDIVPPAVLLLGVGPLTLGIWQRAVSIAVYGVLAWSFLVDLIRGIIGLNHWVLDGSVFHHMAMAPAVAPAVAPNRTTNGILAVGPAMATIGGVLLSRTGPAGGLTATAGTRYHDSGLIEGLWT